MIPHIAAFELRQIQGYVFATRRLLDTVGRSAAVSELTSPAAEAVARGGGQVLFVGGGSFAVRFPSESRAREFAASHTRRVRDLADRLSVVTAVFEQPPDPADTLAAVHEHLVAARAGAQVEHLPVEHAGLASRCSVSAGPAQVIGGGPRGAELLAETVLADRDRARRWHRRWQQILAGLPLPDGAPALLQWALPLELEDMSLSVGPDGEPSDEASMLAVLHLDIDGLGLRLRAYAAEATGEELLQVSGEIAALMTALVTHLSHAVGSAAVWDPVFPMPRPVGGGPERGAVRVDGVPDTLTVPLARSGTGPDAPVVFLPLRPLVVGGDDVTLVCDSRVAWSLMREVERWWAAPLAGLVPEDPRRSLAERSGLFESNEGTLGLTVSMGCAFFRRRSPLVTAYERAAALTEIAKQVQTGNSLAWDLTGRSAQDLNRDHARSGSWLPMEASRFVQYTAELLAGDGQGLRGRGSSRGHTRRLREASQAELELELARRPLQVTGPGGHRLELAPQEVARMLDVFEPLLSRDLVLTGRAGERR